MNTRPLRYNRRDTLAAWLMLTPFLIFFALFVVYPIIMLENARALKNALTAANAADR